MGESPTAALQQLFEVAPLACPACQGAMRIVACITQTSVIDQIPTHLCAGLAPALRRRPTPARGAHADAGPFGGRGPPTGASDRSPPGSAPRL